MLIFRCPSCNQQLHAPLTMAGQAVTCPACGAPTNAPGGPHAPSPAASAAATPTPTPTAAPSAATPPPPPLTPPPLPRTSPFEAPSVQAALRFGAPATTDPLAPRPRCSRLVYIILAVFLGWLGVHNFVAGYTSRGVAQLVISLVGIVTGFCTIGITTLICGLAVFIWYVVDIITVDRDVAGIKMD